MKIFATANILQAMWALPPVTGKTFFKFSIRICINCIGKMHIWGHFHCTMELLLNNYLGYFLIFEKTFVVLFIESAIKPTPLLCANIKYPGILNATNWIYGDLNVSMNQSHQSPFRRVASQSFYSVVYTGPTGACVSMLGQINLKLMEELEFSKSLTDNGTIMK